MKLSPSVTIEQSETGLEFIKVASEFCDATIFLQGAQITEFTPTGKKPLLWVSQQEDYQEGKGVRGGIPICWPWFGVSQHEGWPAHGVARTGLWRAEQVKEEENSIYISLSLPMNQIDEKYWPHKTKLLVEFILSTSLEVRLTTTNLDNETLNFTQALHTYFPTPAIEETKVDGLQGSKYIEFGEGPFEQHDLVSFARETDMVYTQAQDTQRIITPDGIIEVSRENSRSCVLWNPWIDKSKRLSNFADDEYHVMLCLEAANVLEDSVELAPGDKHTLATSLRWV
ncbi:MULTISPECIES: D-hexose-6-phosphate mutarotase [unclassified Pseudoalteromonas]|uniref:D-hexose-6-phosphate mutarotase n=1 Tax=unclassified Pseudoalteromonas TaxID=194690 RepID=UPI0010239026|nr:D-hexose-6-phosphate mutarotase [Pseudoalteromonas sp. L1]RZF90905.1 D-hexose-6-phosphate mutarotase [Pseudoalteromonas sp. CO302Y]RZG08840.1 D-hexose-6-phosphate mutarotase [Pseudoalteromonas sp. CO133X]WOC26195.1 D-hexose-6-phosphate mutarotase [Pseudoalteromonas sp. N1230-9]